MTSGLRCITVVLLYSYTHAFSLRQAPRHFQTPFLNSHQETKDKFLTTHYLAQLSPAHSIPKRRYHFHLILAPGFPLDIAITSIILFAPHPSTSHYAPSSTPPDKHHTPALYGSYNPSHLEHIFQPTLCWSGMMNACVKFCVKNRKIGTRLSARSRCELLWRRTCVSL